MRQKSASSSSMRENRMVDRKQDNQGRDYQEAK